MTNSLQLIRAKMTAKLQIWRPKSKQLEVVEAVADDD